MKAIRLALITGLLIAAPLAAQEETAQAVIENAVATLAEKMDGRREELAGDRQQLYALIDEILLPRFDRKYAAMLVLAKHGRSASDEQRDRFIEAFYQALLRRYADGVLEFEQDRVKVLPFRGDETKKRTKVRSVVSLVDGSDVAVDYELVRRKSGWLLFNVVVEGVSYVRNFRAELDSEIRSDGLDAVIRRLENEAGITTDG